MTRTELIMTAIASARAEHCGFRPAPDILEWFSAPARSRLLAEALAVEKALAAVPASAASPTCPRCGSNMRPRAGECPLTPAGK